jgi:murein DD-endopeptidase MepM/ murein hydrolase activator NlpD
LGLEHLLKKLFIEFTPVLDISNNPKDYTPIDLSVDNTSLQLELDKNSTSVDWENYMDSYLALNNKKVAYGGYLEHRFLYERSEYFTQQALDKRRNRHLGVDLWCPTNTGIIAPIHGVVHSYANNTNHGDYGPTIILKHTVDNNVFYTLYGHLSLESIETIQIDQEIKKGECFAYLGASSVNGDYAPHLHFQVIKDMEEKKGDYPGVSSTNDLPFYKKNCPDPNLILNLTE